MKKNIYRWIGWAAAAMLTALLSASCGTEPVLEMKDNAGDALMISPALLDMQGHTLRTRALSADDLKDTQYNENKVNRLDVFFFKAADDAFVQAYHIETTGSPVAHGDVTGYLLSNDWSKDNLEKNVAYKVFIVANSTNATVTSATSGVTLAGLQALTVEDADIYKRFKSGAAATDVTYTASKAFLMNAQVNWTILESGTQLVSGDKITLSRAAVKFVMDVSLSSEFAARLTAAGEQYGAPSWKFVNFNKVNAEVPGGTAPAAALMTAGSSNYLEVEQGTGDQAGHYTVVTYAYPQTWTAATMPDAAPAIFLSFPSRPIGSPTATPAYHYYYIPICSQSTTATVSNNLYKVNAVISSFGSSEVITSDPVNLNYEVMPWGTSYTADIEATATDYLLASPTTYVFKGGTVGEFLSTKIKYYASGTVTIKEGSTTAFYIDKNGDPQPVAASQYSIGTPASGEILIQSKVPTNGTMQQVEFTVKCGDKEQVVKFRHYPLDFITAEDGAYSTYTDTRWAAYGTNGTYIASGVTSNRFTFFTNSPDDHAFGAKVFYNGGTYYITTTGGRGNQRKANANNQMYVLQLTSAGDEYTLGRPVLTTASGNIYNNNGTNIGNVDYALSNDDVMSPAFMLGSQLAAINTDQLFSTVQFAAMHCALYKEVITGKEYTGWRLPTKQELLYMAKNQRENSEAMDDVMTARRYWALNGEQVDNPYYSAGNYTSVRCVRDMSKEELDEINKFE